MCHVFWTKFYGTNKPLWLCEGMACVIGKNFSDYNLGKLIKKYRISPKILHYRYIKKKLTGHIPFYPIWSGFIDYIIKENGINKVLLFMRKFSRNPNKKNYDKLFRQLFGFGSDEKTLFKKFIESATDS